MSSTINNSVNTKSTTPNTSIETKIIRKKSSGWRWFIGMYFVSLITLGSFHAFSHYFTTWLNGF